MAPISQPSSSIALFSRNSSIGSISNFSALAWMFSARYTRVAVLSPPSPASAAATTPQHSIAGFSSACATICSSRSSAIFIRAPDRRRSGPALPPDRRVQVLDLLDGQRVDDAGQILHAVVGADEHDVALVELARYAHGDARDGAAGHSREHALVVEQLARPHDRV